MAEAKARMTPQGNGTRPDGPRRADPFGLMRWAVRLNAIALDHAAGLARDQGDRWQATLSQTARMMRTARMTGRHDTVADWAGHWRAYLRDSAERAVLAADILRARNDALLDAEAADEAPALPHAHEPVMDATAFPRPCNARLVRLVPAAPPDPAARPVLLLVDRASGPAGLDAAAAAALRAGQPCYAVVFTRVPLPGQTVADAIDACAAFAAEIARRHPEAPAPLVLGRGAGGWMPLVLAAACPDGLGAVVLDAVPLAPARSGPGGAPMAMAGGAVTALMSDLGGGLQDGATAALGAALADPAAAWLRPLAGLLAEADRAGPRTVEAAHRGGGFPLLTAAEARWMAAVLPPGDCLARNAAALAPGRPLDLRAVRAPVVLCLRPADPVASPAQALGWIGGTYADDAALRAAGQRIVLLRDAGGPGLLLSGTIEGRQALTAIEALAPGLYDLRVETIPGRGAAARAMLRNDPIGLAELAALADDPGVAFAAAARAARLQDGVYDATAHPVLRAAIAPPAAGAMRALHPMRLLQAALSSRNPWLGPVAAAARQVREGRHAAAPDNPFLWIERMGFDLAGQWLDLACGLRDAARDVAFHAVWDTPWARAFAGPARPDPAPAATVAPSPARAAPRPSRRTIPHHQDAAE